jgi:hypothetical protein
MSESADLRWNEKANNTALNNWLSKGLTYYQHLTFTRLFISFSYMSKKLLLWASLASLPLISQAQTEAASSHFYVGAGVNLVTNVPFTSSGTPRVYGPSLTTGVNLAPRLALQASVAYQRQNYSGGSAYNSGAGISYESYSSRSKHFTIPVLLRYTLTPSPKRFQFDGLAGITVLHSSYHYESTSTSSAGYINNYETNDGQTRASVTLGPAVRYAVSPKVELTANGLVSAVIGDTYYRFSDRLFLNVLVGAQYSFGSR